MEQNKQDILKASHMRVLAYNNFDALHTLLKNLF